MKNSDNELWRFLAVIGTVVLAVYFFYYDKEPAKQTKPTPVNPLVKQEPEPLTRMEFKYSENGKSYKYWTDSAGNSGGDQSWVIPVSYLNVEVNIYKGSVAVSSRKLPLFKLGADLSGDVKLSFAPSLKAGPLSVGMSLELARLNMREQLGMGPGPSTNLYRGLDPTRPFGGLSGPSVPFSNSGTKGRFETPNTYPFTSSFPFGQNQSFQFSDGFVLSNTPKPSFSKIDLSGLSYNLNMTVDPKAPLDKPSYQYDLFTGERKTPVARLSYSNELKLKLLGEPQKSAQEPKYLGWNAKGELELLPLHLFEFNTNPQQPMGLNKRLQEIKPVKPEDLDLSELMKTLPLKK